MEPVLGNAAQLATVEYMRAERVGKGIVAEAVVGVGPDHVDTPTVHDGETAAQLHPAVPRASRVSIVEARRGDLIRNERVAHVRLKHRAAVGEPFSECPARADLVIPRVLRIETGIEPAGPRRGIRELRGGGRLEGRRYVAVDRERSRRA